MSYYDKFLKLCANKGMTPSRAAIEIGLSKATVNKWKNGGNPTDATAMKDADFFGIRDWRLEQPIRKRVKVRKIHKRKSDAHE